MQTTQKSLSVICTVRQLQKWKKHQAELNNETTEDWGNQCTLLVCVVHIPRGNVYSYYSITLSIILRKLTSGLFVEVLCNRIRRPRPSYRHYFKKVRLAHGLPWEKLIRKIGGLQLHAGIIFPAVQRRCLKQC